MARDNNSLLSLGTLVPPGPEPSELSLDTFFCCRHGRSIRPHPTVTALIVTTRRESATRFPDFCPKNTSASDAVGSFFVLWAPPPAIYTPGVTLEGSGTGQIGSGLGSGFQAVAVELFSWARVRMVSSTDMT